MNREYALQLANILVEKHIPGWTVGILDTSHITYTANSISFTSHTASLISPLWAGVAIGDTQIAAIIEFSAGNKTMACCARNAKFICLMADYVDHLPVGQVINNIIHEIAHALTDEQGHGPEWRKIARRLGCSDVEGDTYIRCTSVMEDANIWRLEKIRDEEPPVAQQKFSGIFQLMLAAVLGAIFGFAVSAFAYTIAVERNTIKIMQDQQKLKESVQHLFDIIDAG